MVNYRIYPSLLDAYADYRHASEIWETYWGSSEHPAKSLDEFCEEQFQNVIDRINRVPFESEAADRGTALNNLVDCCAAGEGTPIFHTWVKDDVNLGFAVEQNGHTFYFPHAMVDELVKYFWKCMAQTYVRGKLSTMFGEVELYGFVDYISKDCIHDLKTTSRYSVGKYADHWQWVVYPYCLSQMGCLIKNFEYNVVEIGKSSWQTYTETYMVKETDIVRLIGFVEDFIKFLETNRDKITDKKIFNEE